MSRHRFWRLFAVLVVVLGSCCLSGCYYGTGVYEAQAGTYYYESPPVEVEVVEVRTAPAVSGHRRPYGSHGSYGSAYSHHRPVGGHHWSGPTPRPRTPDSGRRPPTSGSGRVNRKR